MLTTEEEYDEMKKEKKPHLKLNYIASCGHEHCVFFNVFLGRKTGVICPACVITKNQNAAKEKITIDKLQHFKQELAGIDYFKEVVKDKFTVIKAFDGCKADIIMKPTSVTEDKWLGIQVKTTKKSVRGYGFHLANDYIDCIILCICTDDKKMWAIPYDAVNGKIKVAIGFNKSKYSDYELKLDTIMDTLQTIYNSSIHKCFEELDTPINIYQQREKEYRVFRETTLDFIQFTNNDMEGMVYDFKIGDKKVQEKVGGSCKNRLNSYIFSICKNNGSIIKKRIQSWYEEGDNDLYWLNCDNERHFYVIPESEMITQGFVNKKTVLKTPKRMLRINPISKNTPSSMWTTPYLFDYANVDKARLMNLISGGP